MTTPVRQPDPTRPGRWCPEHGMQECTKKRKGGAVCHGAAITGLDACRMHAGQRLDVAKAKGEALTAWSALHAEPSVSATEAVLGMLQMSWARVHLYAGLLRRQVEEAQNAPGPGSGVLGEEAGPGAGLIGYTRSANAELGLYATGEAVRGLASLEGQERDRCVRFAKVCHDMGIAEQQVRLAEHQGAMLAAVIRGTLDAHLGRVLEVLGNSAEAETIRRSWQGWVETIVPAQIELVAGGDSRG
ncbi:hypothetical protein GCM10017559_08140 [Streptosporangium longisporum]|uniref:Uncharacterized protein n=1 Tax=Streptosporangium longisporum TaxID=46187 RepID=A0ABP6K7Z1_9ACTN